MKKEGFKKWVLVLLLGLAGAACGTDSGTGSEGEVESESESSMEGDTSVYGGAGSDSRPGNPAAYHGGTQSCSEVFISGYNGVLTCLRTMETVEDAQLCRSRLVSFQTTYARVRCWAVSVDRTTEIKTDTLVDVDSRMAELLDILDKSLNGASYY